VDGGWTVAMVLAHLAFWDRRAFGTLRKWQRTGTQPLAADAEIMNEALEAEWALLPPRKAARLAVEAAERLDAALEAISPTFVATVQESGNARQLSRIGHRTEHIEQIERALSG
jgi:mycothiol maleylpyruvate isomerase-like protein